MTRPKVGQKYMHFKGKGPYSIVAIARDCENPQRELVVYKAEYTLEEFGPNTIWTRELTDFTGNKTLESGEVVLRFKLIE